MKKFFTVSGEEIIHHIKLSLQIPSLIKGIVARKIIAAKAAELGLQVNSAELQQAADDFRLTHKLYNTDATCDWLQKHQLCLDEFKELVYTHLISIKLAQQLFADEVEPFFVNHQLDSASAVLYEVTLDDMDQALKLFSALTKGEMSFPEVAHQYIKEPMVRRSGGYRGVLSRTALEPLVAQAVFAATPPQILEPIVTARGVHLILVEEIIRPQLDEPLRQQLLSDLFSAWLKQQVEQFRVIVTLDSGDDTAPSNAPVSEAHQPVSIDAVPAANLQ